jgi:hypothetical protein
MTRQKWILLIVALLLIGGTAGVLARVKNFQTLGRPGVKTQPLPDSQNLEVLLPDNLPGYKSEKIQTDKLVVQVLPKDTSFGERIYTAPDGFWSHATVVLMGSDRTSIHKPQFCLEGQGWRIDSTSVKNIPVQSPQPYNLPVIKLLTTRSADNATWRGIYVYWFVADNTLSADAVGLKRMGGSALELLHTGTLQRWAYVSFFTACRPGQEDAAFDQMKKLIAESVPEFQLTPAPAANGGAIAAANR